MQRAQKSRDGDGIGANAVTQLVTVTEMTWLEVGSYYWFILPATGLVIVTDSTEMTGMEFGSYQWLILPVTESVIVTESTDGDGIGVNAGRGTNPN